MPTGRVYNLARTPANIKPSDDVDISWTLEEARKPYVYFLKKYKQIHDRVQTLLESHMKITIKEENIYKKDEDLSKVYEEHRVGFDCVHKCKPHNIAILQKSHSAGGLPSYLTSWEDEMEAVSSSIADQKFQVFFDHSVDLLSYLTNIEVTIAALKIAKLQRAFDFIKVFVQVPWLPEAIRQLLFLLIKSASRMEIDELDRTSGQPLVEKVQTPRNFASLDQLDALMTAWESESDNPEMSDFAKLAREFSELVKAYEVLNYYTTMIIVSEICQNKCLKNSLRCLAEKYTTFDAQTVLLGNLINLPLQCFETHLKDYRIDFFDTSIDVWKSFNHSIKTLMQELEKKLKEDTSSKTWHVNYDKNTNFWKDEIAKEEVFLKSKALSLIEFEKNKEIHKYFEYLKPDLKKMDSSNCSKKYSYHFELKLNSPVDTIIAQRKINNSDSIPSVCLQKDVTSTVVLKESEDNKSTIDSIDTQTEIHTGVRDKTEAKKAEFLQVMSNLQSVDPVFVQMEKSGHWSILKILEGEKGNSPVKNEKINESLFSDMEIETEFELASIYQFYKKTKKTIKELYKDSPFTVEQLIGLCQSTKKPLKMLRKHVINSQILVIWLFLTNKKAKQKEMSRRLQLPNKSKLEKDTVKKIQQEEKFPLMPKTDEELDRLNISTKMNYSGNQNLENTHINSTSLLKKPGLVDKSIAKVKHTFSKIEISEVPKEAEINSSLTKMDASEFVKDNFSDGQLIKNKVSEELKSLTKSNFTETKADEGGVSEKLIKNEFHEKLKSQTETNSTERNMNKNEFINDRSNGIHHIKSTVLKALKLGPELTSSKVKLDTPEIADNTSVKNLIKKQIPEISESTSGLNKQNIEVDFTLDSSVLKEAVPEVNNLIQTEFQEQLISKSDFCEEINSSLQPNNPEMGNEELSSSEDDNTFVKVSFTDIEDLHIDDSQKIIHDKKSECKMM